MVPALPQQEKTTAPNVAAEGHSTPVVNDQGQQIGTENGYYEVTISGSEEGAVIEYRITDADGVGEWQVYDGTSLIFDEDGQYTVEARAKVEGKDYSDITSATFVVTERTSIDELVNGKAVASVRYFNLAGQEMQEANGMTIVVTTYTDGTTSAVKVMK